MNNVVEAAGIEPASENRDDAFIRAFTDIINLSTICQVLKSTTLAWPWNRRLGDIAIEWRPEGRPPKRAIQSHIPPYLNPINL